MSEYTEVRLPISGYTVKYAGIPTGVFAAVVGHPVFITGESVEKIDGMLASVIEQYHGIKKDQSVICAIRDNEDIPTWGALMIAEALGIPKDQMLDAMKASEEK